MNRRHLVAGVMQDVACLEFDRLEVRREQLEIRITEPLEKIVLGPTRSHDLLWPGIGTSQNPTFP
ncbi:hypothetical protein ACVWWK_006002 [Bradyrhizobium sp. LB9.1b]